MDNFDLRKYLVEGRLNKNVTITFNNKEINFLKRALEFYWEQWNASHDSNEEDFNITQNINKKLT